MKIAGYLWSLPHSLLGLLMSAIYWPRKWRWSDGCLEAISERIWGNPAGQSWGWIIYYSDEQIAAMTMIRVHERVHVKQAFWLGPLFPISYVLHFLWLYLFAAPETPMQVSRWKRCYYEIWAEKQAYRVQGEYFRGIRPGQWGSKKASEWIP